MQKNRVIQALRGIAALGVVIFHASALLGTLPGETRHAIYGPLAAAGVDLFFLISGYIIASSIYKRDNGWGASGAFLLRRLIRIWPPYAIATGIFCLAFSLKNGTGPTFIEIVRSLTFTQLDTTAPYYGFAALVVGWTLNYEMLFYLLIAVSLMMPYRWIFIVAAFFVVLVIVPLSLQPDLTPVQLLDAERQIANSMILSNPLCWLFLLGAGVHFLERHSFAITSHWLFAILAMLSLAFAVTCYLMPIMNKHGLTGMGLAVLPFFTVTTLSRSLLEHLVPKWLVYMGDISFSLYLTHIIVLSMVKAALAASMGENILLMLVAIGASVAGGAFYFSMVERPITRGLSSLRRSRPARQVKAVI